jgi:hypothetical protein
MTRDGAVLHLAAADPDDSRVTGGRRISSPSLCGPKRQMVAGIERRVIDETGRATLSVAPAQIV